MGFYIVVVCFYLNKKGIYPISAVLKGWAYDFLKVSEIISESSQGQSCFHNNTKALCASPPTPPPAIHTVLPFALMLQEAEVGETAGAFSEGVGTKLF